MQLFKKYSILYSSNEEVLLGNIKFTYGPDPVPTSKRKKHSRKHKAYAVM